MSRLAYKLLSGCVPVELVQVVKENVVAYHITDGYGLQRLLKLQGKDKPVCTFTKSGSGKHLWGGPETGGSYCVKLTGKSIYQFHGDLWTDKVRGQRVINLVHLNGSIREDLKILISALRDEVFHSIKHLIPMGRWESIKALLADTYDNIVEIEDLPQLDTDVMIKAVKRILDKVDFNELLKSTNPKKDTDYNEVLLTDFKVLEVYKTDTPELEYPHETDLKMSYEEFCQIK